MKRHDLFAIGKHGAEQAAGAGASHEMFLVGRFVVGVSGRDHHALDADFHHLVEEVADAVGIGAIEESGVGGHAETGCDGGADSVESDVVSTFAADGKIVVLFLSVHVNGEAQILAGLEQVQLFFQQQRIGAEIDIFLARHKAFDNFVDLGMHQRFAAGDGDHGRSAFVDGFEAGFRREIGFQDVGWVLDLAASGAGQVAAEQRLEHEHERIALASGQFLAQNVGGHCPHLGYGNCHCFLFT